ncbi:MAG: 50S ribosomal protein L29 [Deltaproteobacteria bacterium]|nr:50S ribosomal protein L29 [Deltaproteobacteria bacterium]
MATDNETLVASLGQTERELVQARLDLSIGRLENTARIRVLRKKYARISTKLRQAEIADNLAKGSLATQARISASPTEAPVETPAVEARGGFLKGIVDRLSGKSE